MFEKSKMATEDVLLGKLHRWSFKTARLQDFKIACEEQTAVCFSESLILPSTNEAHSYFMEPWAGQLEPSMQSICGELHFVAIS